MEGGGGTTAATTFGRYRVVQRLGEGGMGVVHLAADPDGRSVALKALRPGVLADPAARRRLAREVDALQRVRHPRIAKVLDADVDADVPYLVTEFVAGPALDAAIAAAGPLDAPRLRRLGEGLLEALTHLHDVGVVHRDVKPANVVLRGDDPVLIDFGIAHFADASRITSVGLVMGTPGYLSPEAAAGGDVDERADWWGWAATLAFAATGRPPFGEGAVPVVLERVRCGHCDLDGVSSPLRDVLADALSVDPSARPGPRELLDAVGAPAAPAATVPATVLPGGPSEARTLPRTRIDLDARGGVPPTLLASKAATAVLTAPDVGVLSRGGVSAAAPAAPAVTLSTSAARLLRRSDTPTPGVLVTAVVVAASVLLVGAAGVAPRISVPATAALVLLARLTDRVHRVRARRRQSGRRRHERLALAAGMPVHVVAEALATTSALAVPVIAGYGAALAATRLGLPEKGPGPWWEGSWAWQAVLVGSAVALGVACVRPEAGPMRSGARLLARAALRTERRTAVVLAVVAAALVGVTVCLALGVHVGA